MKIKVCGMKYPENMEALSQLPIDMMGFIFYNKSPRYAGNMEKNALNIIPERIKKVGVFVNEQENEILSKIKQYDLSMIQLHGQESPEFCQQLKDTRIEIIKAFSVSDANDLAKTVDYESVCDYFLFDTKTDQYGGSGKKFDWEILSTYTDKKPFFLSGGIDLEDASKIRNLKLEQLYAIDLNSKFESEPGKKDIQKLQQFITSL